MNETEFKFPQVEIKPDDLELLIEAKRIMEHGYHTYFCNALICLTQYSNVKKDHSIRNLIGRIEWSLGHTDGVGSTFDNWFAINNQIPNSEAHGYRMQWINQMIEQAEQLRKNNHE